MVKADQASAPGRVEDLSYTEASAELDSIVEFFEGREVDIDQLVPKLERATAIVDELDIRLRQTRAQVNELVPKLERVANGSETDDDLEDEIEGTVAI